MKRSLYLFFIFIILFLPIVNVNAKEMDDITALEFVNDINIGINIGNSLDSYPSSSPGDRFSSVNLDQEILWHRPKNTQALFTYIKQTGINTVKIPVTWYYNTYDDNGTTVIYQEWMNRVKEVVDYAINADLNVIISTHHDSNLFPLGITDQDQINAQQKLARDLWKQIAEEFKDYDERLIFDSFSELVYYGKKWAFNDLAAEQNNELNQIFVDTVRSTGGNNAKRILMIPTLSSKYSSDFLDAFKLPVDSVNYKLIVNVHCYLELFDQNIDSTFKQLSDFSKKNCVPVLIGEFGPEIGSTVVDDNFEPVNYREKAVSNFVARAGSYGIKCIWWDNGSTRKLIDRENLTANSGLLNAMLYPKAYSSGDYTYTFDKFTDFVKANINKAGSVGSLASDSFGRIVTDSNGDPIAIPDGTDYLYIFFKSIDEASSIIPKNIAFYDVDGNFISIKVSDSSDYWWPTSTEYPGLIPKLISVPSDAKFFRISMYKSTSTTYDEYQEFFNNNLLALYVKAFNTGDDDSLFVDNSVQLKNLDLNSCGYYVRPSVKNPDTGLSISNLFIMFIIVIIFSLFLVINPIFRKKD